MSRSQERELTLLEEEVVKLKVSERVCQETSNQYQSMVSKMQRDLDERYRDLKEMAQTLGAAQRGYEDYREKKGRLELKVRDLEARERAELQFDRQATKRAAALQDEYDKKLHKFENLQKDLKADDDALKEKKRKIRELDDLIIKEERRTYPNYANILYFKQERTKEQEKVDRKRGDWEEKNRRKEREGRELEGLKGKIEAYQPNSADSQKLRDELNQKRNKLQATEVELHRRDRSLARVTSDMTEAKSRHLGSESVVELNSMIVVLQHHQDKYESQRIAKEQTLKDKKERLKRQESQSGNDEAERMQKIKDLVSKLSYCRDSMERYTDPKRRETIRTDRAERQKRLERIYTDLVALVG